MVHLKHTIRWQHIGDNYFGVSFDNEGMLLPGVITLNEVGYDIVQQLTTPTTQKDIVHRLLKTYDIEASELSAYVNNILQYLEEQDMLIKAKE